MQDLKRVFTHLGPFKKEFILSILFIIAETGFELTIPLIMADIIDVGVQTRDIHYICIKGVQMGFCALLSLITGLLYARYAARAALGFGSGVREAEFSRIQSYSFANLDHFSTSSLITRMTTDITVMQNAITGGLRPMVRGPVMLIMGLFLAFWMNAALALVFVICTPVLACILFFIVRRVAPLYGKLQLCMDRVNAAIQENLTAIRAVKAFVREEYEEESLREGQPGAGGHQPHHLPLCGAEPARLPAHHVHLHRAHPLVRRRLHPDRQHAGGGADRLLELCTPDRQLPHDDIQRVPAC